MPARTRHSSSDHYVGVIAPVRDWRDGPSIAPRDRRAGFVVALNGARDRRRAIGGARSA